MKERIRTAWKEKWAIPPDDLVSVLFFFATIGLFFVWFGLSVFGVEAKAIRAAHQYLPQWFFFVNLFLPSVLAAAGACPLKVPRLLRFVLAILMFCSLSLFVVTREHQAIGLAMLGFLYLEAYWIIPRWSRWVDRKTGRVPVLPLNPRKKRRKSILLDYAIYVVIALAIASGIVAYALRKP